MRHVPVPDLPDDFPIRHAQAHGVWRYSYHALSGIRVHKCVCVSLQRSRRRRAAVSHLSPKEQG